MTFLIDSVNLLPYVAADGFKWSLNDLDSEDAGRTLDGVMHRGRVAYKRKIQIECRPLNTYQLSVVLNAILPEFVSVTYDDPLTGSVHTCTMYCSTRPANMKMAFQNDELWDGISFSLIER